jgi:hypothetical protein
VACLVAHEEDGGHHGVLWLPQGGQPLASVIGILAQLRALCWKQLQVVVGGELEATINTPGQASAARISASACCEVGGRAAKATHQLKLGLDPGDAFWVGCDRLSSLGTQCDTRWVAVSCRG